MLNSKSIIPLYYYSRKRIKSIGIQWQNNKSDMEAAEAIKDKELRELFIEIVQVFYSEYYGDIIDTSLDKSNFYKKLESYIKKQKNIFSYYFNKII